MNATFTFYKRPNSKRKSIYYVRFRDSDTGQRLAGISTGKTTKAEATSWAINKLENGIFMPRKEQKFRDFTK
ncbi:MAG: hypothetical protein U9N32_06625, partial [Spirochaetota bacterium]|nr:hypothetical protein [Spirochaetota bacterium]